MFIIIWCLLCSVVIFPQDGLVQTFYTNGNLESAINFKDSVRDGESKFYFENGNIKEERIYVNGRVEGLVKIYSESGKLREVFVIENGRREGPTNLFDENGNYLSDVLYENGKLVIPAIVENYFAGSEERKETKAIEEIENPETKPEVVKPKEVNEEYLLPPEVEEEKLEDDQAFFSTLEVTPEPVGGMEAIYRKLIYPSEAKNNEIQGTVKVKAFIDEYGEVMDVQIVEGIGNGCDDVARNAVYFAKFKPGLQRGKAVKSMIIIPIKFNPEMSQN